MHLKTLLASILLLALPEAAFASPDGPVPVRYVQASSLGMTKRDSFTLNIQPLFMAMPLNASPLVKRQQCPMGSSVCYNGCCNIGTVCGIYGGKEGCCPVGKRCGSVSGCQNSDDVFCQTYCCPAGSTCTTDSTGAGSCGKTTDNPGNTGSQCDPGTSPCKIFDGCCPTGAECKLPKNCNIPCTSSDPVCGAGCCLKGYVCASDLTCSKDNSGSFTTLVQPTTRTTKAPTSMETSPTDLPSDTLINTSTGTTGSSSFTVIHPNNSVSTSTSTTSTSTNIPTATSRIPINNSAPTMGAMLGGSLGIAAGVLGVLAM